MPITRIREAYEKARIDVVIRGSATPPPSWMDIGELLLEIDNLQAELKMARESDDCGPR